MRCGMEGKERQSLPKDTRSKRSICTYARMRLAVADLTVFRGPVSSEGQPPLVSLPLEPFRARVRRRDRAYVGRSRSMLHSTSAVLQLWQASPRARTATACVFLLSHPPSGHRFGFCALFVGLRLGSDSFAARRARLPRFFSHPASPALGSSAEHAPSRVTSHTTNPLRSARHGFLWLRHQPAPGPRSSDQRPRLWPARRLCQLQWRGSR